MAREVQACGTDAAYRRHRRAGEPACQACREAHAAYVKANKAKQVTDRG